MIDKMFGNNFVKNKFLEGLSDDCKVRLLTNCAPINIAAGDYVYSSNQVADKGTDGSPVYLIISGRVSCRLTRNVCFKQYISGSYFGDVDAFNHIPRLFSVRAEEPVVVAVLERDKVMEVLHSDRPSELAVLTRTLRRYLSYKLALKKIIPFNKIMMQNEWWDEQDFLEEEHVNLKINRFLELIRADMVSPSKRDL